MSLKFPVSHLIFSLILVVSVSAYANDRQNDPASRLIIDALRNTSNLSDEELMWSFDRITQAQRVELLDHDGNGLADGTCIDVQEFIERMRIILESKAARAENSRNLEIDTMISPAPETQKI